MNTPLSQHTRGDGTSTSLTHLLLLCPPPSSEEQDPVPGRRLHHDPEDGEDVALQEEAQTSVGVVTEAQIITIFVIM